MESRDRWEEGERRGKREGRGGRGGRTGGESLMLAYRPPTRITSDKISAFLPSKRRNLWKERATKQWVVLVDEDSTSDGLADSSNVSPILIIKDAIHKVLLP